MISNSLLCRTIGLFLTYKYSDLQFYSAIFLLDNSQDYRVKEFWPESQNWNLSLALSSVSGRISLILFIHRESFRRPIVNNM